MRFKGKAKKLNVTYTTIAKCTAIAATIATVFAFLANKLPTYMSKETTDEKSYRSDDDDTDDRRRRRRRREERRDETSREGSL